MSFKSTVKFDGDEYLIDLNQEIDISIAVRFDEKQFKAFGATTAQSKPFQLNDFVASVDNGAGCNCPVFTFSSHLHGTHTECVGHISKQKHIVQDVVGHPQIMTAILISVEPVKAIDCGESYSQNFTEGDKVITRSMLEESANLKYEMKSLIIRTLPNDGAKQAQDYDREAPSFFTNEAIQFITDRGIEHLLLDMPSIDRLKDEGRLSNHHIFWGVEQGSHDVPNPSSRSVTEFIYVPSEVVDGVYALSLNIGNIRSDAAPSRPVLYEMERK